MVFLRCPVRLSRLTAFSLIDVRLSLAVIAITASLALPMSQAMLQQNRLATQTNALVRDLNFVRHKAVSQRMRMSVCASRDGQHCAGNWSQGWLMFTDSGVPGLLDGNDQIVLARTRQAQSTITLEGGTHYVTFLPTGASHFALHAATDKNRVATRDQGILPGLFRQLGKPVLAVTALAGVLPGPARAASGAVNTATGLNCASALTSGGAGPRCGGTTLASLDADAHFLFCDKTRRAERGNLLSVTPAGRIYRQAVTCD